MRSRGVDLFCYGSIDNATHQEGMKMKIRVWHANHIYDIYYSGDVFESRPDRLLVVRIPDGDLGQRIATEHLF